MIWALNGGLFSGLNMKGTNVVIHSSLKHDTTTLAINIIIPLPAMVWDTRIASFFKIVYTRELYAHGKK